MDELLKEALIEEGVIQEQQESTLDGKYLTFQTAGQLFAVPIADVVRIIGIQEITEMPDYPEYAKGIINLGGTIIPVIDVRIRLKKGKTDLNSRTCTIIIDINQNYFGFIVDEVKEVTYIDDSQISPPPKMSDSDVNRFLTGVGRLDDKLVLLADTTKLLGDEGLNLIKK